MCACSQVLCMSPMTPECLGFFSSCRRFWARDGSSGIDNLHCGFAARPGWCCSAARVETGSSLPLRLVCSLARSLCACAQNARIFRQAMASMHDPVARAPSHSLERCASAMRSAGTGISGLRRERRSPSRTHCSAPAGRRQLRMAWRVHPRRFCVCDQTGPLCERGDGRHGGKPRQRCRTLAAPHAEPAPLQAAGARDSACARTPSSWE